MSSVAQKLLSVPTEIQQLIESDAFLSIIYTICAEHAIPETWAGELARGTIRILCGEMKPVDFIDFIIDEYWVEEDEAMAIAQKINQRIFSLVKPQLALVHKITDEHLAHRVKVPKKPKETNESDKEELPVIETETPSPYVHTSPQNTNQKPAQTTTHIHSVSPTQSTKPPIQTPLASKLSGQTKDPYREF